MWFVTPYSLVPSLLIQAPWRVVCRSLSEVNADWRPPEERLAAIKNISNVARLLAKRVVKTSMSYLTHLSLSKRSMRLRSDLKLLRFSTWAWTSWRTARHVLERFARVPWFHSGRECSD
ncbi:hypothetical protein B0O99DRAFT_638879 [Bisporella sp. PMI_857]|nr:hypothetical protein B0O99DRAFT_638879 [Bisporella sp. PMI_857]